MEPTSRHPVGGDRKLTPEENDVGHLEDCPVHQDQETKNGEEEDLGVLHETTELLNNMAVGSSAAEEQGEAAEEVPTH